MTYKYVSTMCYLGYKDSIARSHKKIKGYLKKSKKTFRQQIEIFLIKPRKNKKNYLAEKARFPLGQSGESGILLLTKGVKSGRIKERKQEAVSC